MDVPAAETSLGNEESEPAGSLFCCLAITAERRLSNSRRVWLWTAATFRSDTITVK